MVVCDHSFMVCIATKNRAGECACDNRIVVVEIEHIEVVFKEFEMQALIHSDLDDG